MSINEEFAASLNSLREVRFSVSLFRTTGCHCLRPYSKLSNLVLISSSSISNWVTKSDSTMVPIY